MADHPRRLLAWNADRTPQNGYDWEETTQYYAPAKFWRPGAVEPAVGVTSVLHGCRAVLISGCIWPSGGCDGLLGAPEVVRTEREGDRCCHVGDAGLLVFHTATLLGVGGSTPLARCLIREAWRAAGRKRTGWTKGYGIFYKARGGRNSAPPRPGW